MRIITKAPAGIVSGFIGLWHGTIVNIPSGYVICDGNNSTPNLLDRFVSSVPNAGTNPGGTGGVSIHTLAEGEIPSHAHSYTLPSTQAGQLGGGGDTLFKNSTTPNTGLTGGGGAHENRPKWYEVAFIMKT